MLVGLDRIWYWAVLGARWAGRCFAALYFFIFFFKNSKCIHVSVSMPDRPRCRKTMSSPALQTPRSNAEQWMDELDLRPGGGVTQDPGETSVHSPSNPRHRFFYLQAAAN
jgi:hypothetical protein